MAANTTMDDIKTAGGKCELVATGFWECTDKNGNVWWCDNTSCQPKPRRLGSTGIVHVNVDLLLVRDRETGDIVIAAPLVNGPRDRGEIT